MTGVDDVTLGGLYLVISCRSQRLGQTSRTRTTLTLYWDDCTWWAARVLFTRSPSYQGLYVWLVYTYTTHSLLSMDISLLITFYFYNLVTLLLVQCLKKCILQLRKWILLFIKIPYDFTLIFIDKVEKPKTFSRCLHDLVSDN